MVQRGLEVRPASTHLGYGGRPTGVFVSLAVRATSARSPLLSVPVPALGVSSVTPYKFLAGTCVPLVRSAPTPSAPLHVPHAVSDVLHANSAQAAVNRLDSPDRRHSSQAFFGSPPLQEGGRSARHVKAPEKGLSDSSCASDGTGAPGNMPGLEPRLYPEGHTMRKKNHRLENLVPSSKSPTSPPWKTAVQREPNYRCRACPNIANNPRLPQLCKEVLRPCTIEAMDIVILVLLVFTQSFPTNIKYNSVQVALIGAVMRTYFKIEKLSMCSQRNTTCMCLVVVTGVHLRRRAAKEKRPVWLTQQVCLPMFSTDAQKCT